MTTKICNSCFSKSQFSLNSLLHYTDRAKEWIQTDFSRSVYLLGAITQSRKDAPNQMVRKYKIAYGFAQNDLSYVADENGADAVS